MVQIHQGALLNIEYNTTIMITTRLRRKLYSISSSDIRRLFGYDIEVDGNFPSSIRLEDLKKLCEVDIPDLVYEKEKDYIAKNLRIPEEEFKDSLVISKISIKSRNQAYIDIDMNSQIRRSNKWLGWWTADIDISGTGKLSIFDVTYND